MIANDDDGNKIPFFFFKIDFITQETTTVTQLYNILYSFQTNTYSDSHYTSIIELFNHGTAMETRIYVEYSCISSVVR